MNAKPAAHNGSALFHCHAARPPQRCL